MYFEFGDRETGNTYFDLEVFVYGFEILRRSTNCYRPYIQGEFYLKFDLYI